MNKVFKFAGYCVLIAAVGSAIGYQGNQKVNKYSSRAELVGSNNLLNTKGEMWHQNPVSDNGKTKTVTDATGTKFENIPDNISDKDLVKHFISRPEWANHNFFGSDYLKPIKWDDYFDQKGKTTPPVISVCDSWQNVLTAKIKADGVYKYIYGDDDLNNLRSDYIRQCAWNSDKDMTYRDDEAVTQTQNGNAMINGCWGLLALFGTIPAIWLGFWRLIGMAVRSAKKGVKGDY